jgi:DNA-binding NarL/FixJ family response regulator
MSASSGLRCVVADDHPAVLETVCGYLEQHGISVVARARTGKEALEQILLLQPDVAVLDLRMPELDGMKVVRQAARKAPDTATILYTGYADQALLAEALDVGASGFVVKDAPLHDLLRAIQVVAGGGAYVDAVLAGALANAAGASVVTLTQREREVLRLLADGFPSEAIGKQLFISPETVRTHVQKAMRKLGADTRTQAVATALRAQLIS